MSAHGAIDPSNKKVALLMAIVLDSAEIVTGVGFLLWASAGLGLIGFVFTLIGFLGPTAVHLL